VSLPDQTAALRGRSVFVTGAYGLLGSWLVAALLDAGAEVTVLRRDRTPVSALGLAGLEPRVSVVEGDITDGPLLERALAEYAVSAVFHLAAQTLVGVAHTAPVATFEANVRGTWTVLEACRRTGVRQVIVASSDKAYGAHAALPYREDYPLQARYPYDASKAAAEIIARSYWHTYELPVAVTRLANLYGGGDLNRSRLIPELCRAVLEGRAPIIRSDGSPERDFLHARDGARAYLAIWGLLAAGRAGGEAFNAGGDRPRSVREVAELACRLGGGEVRPDIRGRAVPAGEIERQWIDSSRLRELTGWAPATGLEAGLAETLDWYREHASALGLSVQGARAGADHPGG
jgi:CDP-glucose 4,6-dehydratase